MTRIEPPGFHFGAFYSFSSDLTAVFVFQVERVVTIMQNPRQYKIPDWFLNRQKDVKDGKYSQVGDPRPRPRCGSSFVSWTSVIVC